MRCDDFDAELLAQLPRESGAARLGRLQFAAGQLPPAREVSTRGPLREEYPAGAVDQRTGNDMDDRLAQPLACCRVPWQYLYFLPEPHGQGSLRPTFGTWRTKGATAGAAATGSGGMAFAAAVPAAASGTA